MSNILIGNDGAIVVSQSQSIPEPVRAALPKKIVIDDARRAGVRLIYEATDITLDIAPWLLGVSFTDGLEKADDFQVTIWDDGRWRGAWSPDHGAKLTVEIHLVENGKTIKLPCVFAIDEIEYSGPPQTAVIKATSAFVTTDLRRDKKSRAWEKISLSEIARTIAGKAGIALMYSARNNPTYTRIDQKHQSDLEFLQRLAEREGLRVKVSDGKLIVYSQAEFDASAIVDTYRWNDPRITAYQFTSGITSAYRQCVVKYRIPSAKKSVEYTYTPTDAPESGQTLRINERCESAADAERVARNRLLAANRGIKGARLDVIGDTRLIAGQNIKITGYGGQCDGNYAIEEACHSLWPYTTSITLRKINV